MTVVVVGGGPTGVETAGALAELYRSNFVTDYPSLPQEKARVVLVEAGDEIFAMFKPNLREYAKDALEQRTVEVLTGARVQSVSPTRVTLSTGDAIGDMSLGAGRGQPRSVAPGLMTRNRMATDWTSKVLVIWFGCDVCDNGI